MTDHFLLLLLLLYTAGAFIASVAMVYRNQVLGGMDVQAALFAVALWPIVLVILVWASFALFLAHLLEKIVYGEQR